MNEHFFLENCLLCGKIKVKKNFYEIDYKFSKSRTSPKLRLLFVVFNFNLVIKINN